MRIFRVNTHQPKAVYGQLLRKGVVIEHTQDVSSVMLNQKCCSDRIGSCDQTQLIRGVICLSANFSLANLRPVSGWHDHSFFDSICTQLSHDHSRDYKVGEVKNQIPHSNIRGEFEPLAIKYELIKVFLKNTFKAFTKWLMIQIFQKWGVCNTYWRILEVSFLLLIKSE